MAKETVKIVAIALITIALVAMAIVTQPTVVMATVVTIITAMQPLVWQWFLRQLLSEKNNSNDIGQNFCRISYFGYQDYKIF